ncbi:HotDog domain-containing protein [Aspergillus tamarii]|uniref:HotDog domain-containing protein n=1 Tax=Aspergillus tamarii TaxID=41984 RepID=A0A5N6UHL9_ASPTM|nr:HotDog domain-containing protein [Aspergillus tamarii]
MRVSGVKGGRLDNLPQFLETHPTSIQALDHFAAIPWINQFLTNPAYKAIPTYGRVRKSDNTEDCFFAQTTNSPTTIPHFLTLQRKDFSPPPESPRGTISLSAGPRTTPYRAPEYPDCITLLDLGSPGLDGHSGILHGGMAGAILDETLGLTVSLHLTSHPKHGLSGMTASLHVTYRAPVLTPSTVVVRTWVGVREGRKWVCRGQIVDGDGVILTEGEALFVTGVQRATLQEGFLLLMIELSLS